MCSARDLELTVGRRARSVHVRHGLSGEVATGDGPFVVLVGGDAPIKRIAAVSLGKMPTTRLLRLISFDIVKAHARPVGHEDGSPWGSPASPFAVRRRVRCHLTFELAHLGFEQEHSSNPGERQTLAGQAENVLDVEDLLA